MARAAPGGPEINDQDFPPRVFQRESRPLGRSPEREIDDFVGVRIFPRLGRDGGLRGVIVSAEQIIAQTIVGAVGKSPDIAQFLPDLAAAGVSVRCVGQRKSARVLLDRAVRILVQFGDFTELLRGRGAGQDRVARRQIFLGRNGVLQFQFESSAHRQPGVRHCPGMDRHASH